MPFATVDGIRTRYEVAGSGPPVLLFSPGGFNATVENWRTFGIYERLRLLDHLGEGYTYITFDKRESGESGGRVEPLTWDDYARQGLGLLDELGIERTHVVGGCIGCSIAITLAVAHPDRVTSLVLYSPAGGPRYRLKQHDRFEQHRAFVAEHGPAEVVAVVRSHAKTFAQDPRVGPWASVIRSDAAFAEDFANRDARTYAQLIADTAQTLFDRDTVPGPEPQQLMALELPALVVPGDDANHAVSAARYLEECLTRSEYWDVPPEDQTEETAPPRVLRFLGAQSSDSPRSSAAI
jgi:pimeloyl-ACP methyl ester carboxylesterase